MLFSMVWAIMNKQDLSIEERRAPEIFMNRLRMLESNTNRLVNQHQALLPLITLIKLIPEVNKHKQSMLSLETRLEETHQSLKQFLISVKESSSKQTANTIKQLTQEIAETKKRLKEVEEHSKKLGKEQLYRARIKNTNINKEIESNLDQLKKDVGCFISEFKSTLGKEYKKQITESECVESYINAKLKDSEAEFNDHTVNLKRQMGLLQCELQFLRDKQLRQQLNKQKQQSLSPDLLAKTQYKFYLDNHCEFQESNTDRLRYQLQLLQNDLKKVVGMKSLQKKSTEISFCRDKYHSLVNQIEGSRWKGIGETMRLENKLERLRGLDTNEGTQKEVEQEEKRLRQVKQIRAKHGMILEQYTSAIESKFKEIQKYL